MSAKKGSNQGREPSDKLWVRLMCGFLGVVMVIAIVFMLLQSFSDVANAVTLTTSGIASTEISVGLSYGDSAEQSFTLASASGFSLSDGSGKTLFKPGNLSLDICPDTKLSYVGVSVQESDDGVPLTKPYHIQISSYAYRSDQVGPGGQDNPAWVNPPTGSGTTTQDKYTLENLDRYMSDLIQSGVLDAYTDSIYPAYADGNYYIRIGQFDTKEDAESTLNGLKQYMDLRSSIVSSEGRGFTVLDAADHSVVCEIVTKDRSVNVRAAQGALSDRDGKEYNGYLTFIRESGERAGLRVVNTFPLEDYVSAILPGVISEDCPEEAAKAMAVILRTNAYRMLGRHSADGFDVCTDHHCHKYSGTADVQSKSAQYVEETAGQILLYDGKPLRAVYNVSAGSATVSAYEAFGTEEYPYLASVETPWETPSEWGVELTADTLRRILNTAGYAEIGTSVKSVSIDRVAEPSGYVSEITFTDYFDHSVTLSSSESIRGVFGGVLSSTNFTVTVSDGSENSRYGVFLFHGNGSGSGIGYSMAGGSALAATGAGYAKILTTYFTGASILGVELEPDPPVTTEAPTTTAAPVTTESPQTTKSAATTEAPETLDPEA